MGRWNYYNVGASAEPEHKKHVQKIFEYIGYAPHPARSGDSYGENIFSNPEVYGCVWSNLDSESGNVKDCFGYPFGEDELFNLLNALFPKTTVYSRMKEGNTISDTWESHDRVYDPNSMTRICMDSYEDYGGDGPNGFKSWKERLALNAPNVEYVQELIDISTADSNGELTELLLELLRKLKEGLIVYEDDASDTRAIGEEYDVEQEGDVDSYYEEYDDDEEDDEEDY